MTHKYLLCLKEVMLQTFQDKKMLAHFFASLIVLTIGIVSNISVPILLKKGVETFSSSNSMLISLILISYGVIWMISRMSADIRVLVIYKIEQRITFVLGNKILSHIYSLSQKYFIDQKPGVITNVIRRAQKDVPSLILGIFLHIIPTVLEFLFVIALVAYFYSLIFSLIMGGTLVIFFVYTFISTRSALKERHIANEVDQNADGVVTDWLSNHETIKAFGQQNLAISICQKELKKRELAEINFMTKLSFSQLGQSIVLGIGLSLLTYIVGQGVLKGELTVGDFVLFNGYILQFIVPMSILGHVTQDIKRAFVDMKGIIEILMTENEINEINHPFHLSDQPITIEFKSVNFKYNEKNIFENLSFKIAPGETVLVTGQTGIGKSTLAKLLMRIYDVNEGQILLNQHNIKNISLSSLYSNIGWVPQETYLLNDTILNNIRFVSPEASVEDIENALYQANLLDFVTDLPQGLNTFVGDKGLRLSGGQKQRLSLARLFLKKPKVCLFDEPTSFLDKDTESIIQQNIEKYLVDTTKIIITHSPFMISKADQIIDFVNNNNFEEKLIISTHI